jgi:hypothetical protein
MGAIHALVPAAAGDPSDVVITALSDAKTQLFLVIAAALTVGVAVWVVKKGYRLFKGFV